MVSDGAEGGRNQGRADGFQGVRQSQGIPPTGQSCCGPQPRPMVNRESLFTSTRSTNAAKSSLGPSAGMCALVGSAFGTLDVESPTCGLPADSLPAPGRAAEQLAGP